MDCREVEGLLGAYLDGELEPAVSTSVRDHADTCAACRERLANLESIGRIVRRAPYYQAPEALRARLTHVQTRSTATSHLLVWAAAAVMVVSRRNITELAAVVDICELIDIKRLIVNRVHLVGQATLFIEDLEISDAEFLAAVDVGRQRSKGRVAIVLGTRPTPSKARSSASPAVPKDRCGINRLAVSPSGDLKFCNEATRGVINLIRASELELDALAATLLSGNHEELLGSVDVCGCLERGTRSEVEPTLAASVASASPALL